MRGNRNDETLAKDKAATLTRRALFELAGLAAAATRYRRPINGGAFRSLVPPPPLRRPRRTCNDHAKHLHERSGWKALLISNRKD